MEYLFTLIFGKQSLV